MLTHIGVANEFDNLNNASFQKVTNYFYNIKIIFFYSSKLIDLKNYLKMLKKLQNVSAKCEFF